MKTIVSALVALSFVAAVAAPAAATFTPAKNAKKLFDQLDREGRGGQSN